MRCSGFSPLLLSEMRIFDSRLIRVRSLLEVWAVAVLGGGAASVLASYLLGYFAFAQSPNTTLRFHLLAPPLQVTIYPAVADPAKDAQVALYVSGAHKGDSLWIAQSDAWGSEPPTERQSPSRAGITQSGSSSTSQTARH
jgi:hypothetical protein